MVFIKEKRTRKPAIWIASILLVLTVLVGICALYVNDYYRADSEAIAAFSTDNSITKEILEDNTILYAPETASAGFIFYPGGKVEYTAYEPLMQLCANQGIFCVLMEMPFNLAVLDMHAAEGIPEQYPQIENWYIGGHSLGGSMAAAHLAERVDTYKGLILLGSYSTADLSETSLGVLSIYGSEDLVLNREKYNENTANLPENFTELVIEGGCHAFFGVYGAQSGDGTPTIPNREQIQITADAISAFVNACNQ